MLDVIVTALLYADNHASTELEKRAIENPTEPVILLKANLSQQGISVYLFFMVYCCILL